MGVPESPLRTGADVVVSALVAEGVRDVFSLPGVHLDALFDALYRRGSDVRLYQTRHEQAVSFMADGYARVSGEIGCCAVVPGAGLLNAATGLATAYACCSQVLCIAGQVDSQHIGRRYGVLHELPDQQAVARALTKWSGCAFDASSLCGLLRRAFTELRSGRPGPVEVDIPRDVLSGPAGAPVEAPAVDPPVVAPEVPDGMDAAAQKLDRAQAPLIFAGSGVLRSGAWDELRQLAERLDCPVVLSTNAQGAMPWDHPLHVNVLGARRLLDAADVVLAVGTRFVTPRGTPWHLRPDQQLVRVNVDPEAPARVADGNEVTLAVDARAALARLIEAVAARRRPDWRERAVAARAHANERLYRLAPQAELALAIRAGLPRDAVIVNGMTQVGYWARLGFPVYRPRAFLTPGYQGALGFELPTALGAQVALRGTARVAVLVGDGGLLYNVQELATAAKYRLPVVCIVFNDNAFGNVRRIQKERYGGRLIGSDLTNPDFMRLAAAFDIAADRATSADDLRRLLTWAWSTAGPVLIEIPVGEMPDPWPTVLAMEVHQ